MSTRESAPDGKYVAHGAEAMPWDGHESCTWEQVGPCVYCISHDVRLYQGTIPADRLTTPPCMEHRWDDGDSMSQAGFYFLCLDCGAQEWTE